MAEVPTETPLPVTDRKQVVIPTTLTIRVGEVKPVPPRPPTPEEARWFLVASYDTHSNEYFAHAAIAATVFIPQIGLMAFLLTTTVRVGSFGWVAFFLAASDALTIYFGGRAVLDAYVLMMTGRALVSQEANLGFRAVSDMPQFASVIRRVARFYGRVQPETSLSIGASMALLAGFVIAFSCYIGWLWLVP